MAPAAFVFKRGKLLIVLLVFNDHLAHREIFRRVRSRRFTRLVALLTRPLLFFFIRRKERIQFDKASSLLNVRVALAYCIADHVAHRQAVLWP